MITFEQACQIAQAHIAKWNEDRPTNDPILLYAKVTEKPYGWIFGYNSWSFFVTGDPRRCLIGNAPLLILKRDGTLYFIPIHPDLAKDFLKKLVRELKLDESL